jgi:hypothetical protein
MKYLQAVIIFLLLIISKRYRKNWRETCDELAEINIEVEASLRRIDAKENGGKPKLQVL